MGNSTSESTRYFGHNFPGFDSQFKFPLVLFVTGDVEARDGLASDGVVFGKFTLDTYPATEFTMTYDDSASAGSEYARIDLAGGTAEIFTDDAALDAFYVGYTERFGGLLIDVGTAGTDQAGGTGPTVTWQYWDGGSWTNLSEVVDDTVDFEAGTSEYYLTWTLPSDWVLSTEGDAGSGTQEAYWVRGLLADANAADYNVEPVLSQNGIEVLAVATADGIKIPFNGYLEQVYSTWQVEGDNDDLELNIINVTRGTHATATLPDDERVSADTAIVPVGGLYFLQGDKMLVQAVSASSVQHADGNLVFVFRV